MSVSTYTLVNLSVWAKLCRTAKLKPIQLYIVHRTLVAYIQRTAAWRAGGGTLKFKRATNFQIPTKLSAKLHPD